MLVERNIYRNHPILMVQSTVSCNISHKQPNEYTVLKAFHLKLSFCCDRSSNWTRKIPFQPRELELRHVWVGLILAVPNYQQMESGNCLVFRGINTPNCCQFMNLFQFLSHLSHFFVFSEFRFGFPQCLHEHPVEKISLFFVSKFHLFFWG